MRAFRVALVWLGAWVAANAGACGNVTQGQRGDGDNGGDGDGDAAGLGGDGSGDGDGDGDEPGDGDGDGDEPGDGDGDEPGDGDGDGDETSSGGMSGSGGEGGTGGQEGTGGSPDCSVDDYELDGLGCWRLYGNAMLAAAPSLEDLLDDVERVGFLPERGNAWYNGDSAPLLYRAVTGDFVFEARVSLFDSESQALTPPVGEWISGGLLVFPSDFLDAGAFNDYYAVKVGTQELATDYGVKGEFTAFQSAETMNPFTRRQVLLLDDDGSANLHYGVRLRVCRVQGRLWTGYFNAEGGYWVAALRQEAGPSGYAVDDPEDALPDLGQTVAIGLGAEVFDWETTNQYPASIRFEDIELRTLTESQPSDCISLDPQ